MTPEDHASSTGPTDPRILPHDEQTPTGLQPVVTLPGHGVTCPDEDCGEPWGFKACQAAQREGADGHDVEVIQNYCGDRFCPTGWEGWAAPLGQKAEDRLLGAHRAYREHGVNLGPVKHVPFSPPVDAWERYPETKEGIGQLIRDAYEIAKVAGVEGGVIVPHLWRILDRYKGPLREEGYGRQEDGQPQRSDKGGLWEGVREDALELGSWEEYVYHSPHAHILGYGWLTDAEELNDISARLEAFAQDEGRELSEAIRLLRRRKDPMEDQLADLEDDYPEPETGGWVYKNKGRRNSIAGTAHYLLTHASIAPKTDATTWFGCVSTAKLLEDAVEELTEADTCGCGQPRLKVPYDYHGHPKWDEAEPALETTTRTTYSLRHPPPDDTDRPPPAGPDPPGQERASNG